MFFKRTDLMQQMLEVQIPDSEVATATRGINLYKNIITFQN